MSGSRYPSPRPCAWRALLALALVSLATPAFSSELITNAQARRHGLTRTWFTQARVDPSRSWLESVVLEGDRLFVLSSAGALQAIDASTGEVVWTTLVGNPAYPSLGPVASKAYVAVVNGGEVYVLDRKNGTVLLERSTASGIAAAPAVTESYVYVPQFSGRVDAFAVGESRPTPWHFTSAGRIFEDAVSSPKSVIWSTDRGHLYVADPSAGSVRFRFESTSPVVAPATVQAGAVFAASLDGYVYSLNEQSGAQNWRYACGASVSESPVALGETLMVVSEEPALHCLDAATGRVRWISRGVSEFVSASPERVYALDKIGNMVVLDREHGVTRGRAAIAGAYQAVLNEQTDRLFVYTRNGLIQCLHEIGLDEPAQHAPKAAAEESQAPAEASDAADDFSDDPAIDREEEPMDEEPAEEPSDNSDDPFGGGGNPFGGGADPFGGGGDPFGGGGEDPFGGGGGDNPFGE